MRAMTLAAATHSHVFVAAATVHLLADGDDDLGAGFIAFMVVVAMSVACYFLFKSMTRHMRKVPASFDPPAPATDPDET
jgi:hypothetical protein